MACLDVVFEEMESEDVSNRITGDIKYHELNQFFSQIRLLYNNENYNNIS